MFDIVCNSNIQHDFHYYVEVYSPIIIGLFAAFIAWITNKTSDVEIQFMENRINSKPFKVLKFKTPKEALVDENVPLTC